MKANIHPEQKDVTFTCQCGNTFTIKSTLKADKYPLEVCSACHPHYTGEKGRHKRTGNVEKFRKKYNLEDAA